ncbi:EcsC family protein [Pseudalkalibacillus hwajinpoensis]|uniref:EcsC family protein n=1 Tax=Guptibacillus hwajinpoensis TaxID=208199 RepID=A0A4U1MEQ5_9BACL|nr:EcsC family protein [Pseudalkalibacillus hwajinpoensis]TKD68700.1 EcsC family protein [Pseudalkalibacillus hwajinpoensis]
MGNYRSEIEEELESWERKMKKKSSIVSRTAKNVQNRINNVIPERVHKVVTGSIKTMVQGVLAGNTYTVKAPVQNLSLRSRDTKAKQLIQTYKRIAAAEGAGTGAGGILLGLADFPLLLSIKIKFLFDLASIYGYDAKQFEERVFILYIFQLAFSSDRTRKEVYERIQNWDQSSLHKQISETFNEKHDWKAFQLEYRDYIDFPKLLQMIPGIGAIVGAYVNYHFIDWLGETAINAYRQRLLQEEYKEQ